MKKPGRRLKFSKLNRLNIQNLNFWNWIW